MWFEVLVPDVSVSEGVIDGERKKKESGAQRLGETLWGHLYFKCVKRSTRHPQMNLAV